MLAQLDKFIWWIYHEEGVRVGRLVCRGYYLFGRLVKIGPVVYEIQ